MARSIWTGSVSFGLVNVPVRLYSATQDHKVHFHQFEKGTPNRIRNERVNEQTGDEVDYKDIVKGAEVDDGKYVVLTQEELESVEPDRRRHREEAVRAAREGDGEVRADRGGDLRDARQAVPRSDAAVERGTRAGDDALRRRGPRPAKELDNLPKQTKVAPKDLKMAVSLVESLTTKWDPRNYRDTHQDRVKKLINAKKNDREVVREEMAEETSEKVVDLLEALQASVDRAKGHRTGNADRAVKLRTRKAGAEDKAEPTKKKLHDLASELGIAGRSKMSAKDLTAAIKKAQKSKGKGGSRKKAS